MDAMVVFIERSDAQNLKVPDGDQASANDQWLPGGYTSGGVAEATLDLPSDLPFREIPFGGE